MNVLLVCLDPSEEERPETVELAARLVEALTEPTEAERDSSTESTRIDVHVIADVLSCFDVALGVLGRTPSVIAENPSGEGSVARLTLWPIYTDRIEREDFERLTRRTESEASQTFGPTLADLSVLGIVDIGQMGEPSPRAAFKRVPEMRAAVVLSMPPDVGFGELLDRHKDAPLFDLRAEPVHGRPIMVSPARVDAFAGALRDREGETTAEDGKRDIEDEFAPVRRHAVNAALKLEAILVELMHLFHY